ncbi:MAG: HRDC domain-containing protein [Chitinivibrionia bacterium]|nr:HRDC domain-containing protein [Chitinivibrionia bacterium]
MQVKVFTIPATDDGTLQEDLNKFLGNHKILEVEQKFYDNAKGGYWSFCVRYIIDATKKYLPAQQSFSGKPKPNYKEILSEQEYQMFLQFKEARMAISKEEGILPYNVFTDAELAEIIRLPERNEQNISKINGIGEKRATKYGKILVEKYAADNVGAKNLLPENNEINNVGAGSARPKAQTDDNLGGQTPPLQTTQQELF